MTLSLETINGKQYQPLPKIRKGEERVYIKCNECGRPAFYDFVPYSLSMPVMYMKCGHGLGRKLHQYTTEITEAEFHKAMAEFEVSGDTNEQDT